MISARLKIDSVKTDKQQNVLLLLLLLLSDYYRSCCCLSRLWCHSFFLSELDLSVSGQNRVSESLSVGSLWLLLREALTLYRPDMWASRRVKGRVRWKHLCVILDFRSVTSRGRRTLSASQPRLSLCVCYWTFDTFKHSSVCCREVELIF